MPTFEISTTTVKPGIIRMDLSGELDASTAAQFRDEINQAAGQELKRLVLFMEALDYMASAGIRVLVFAKQKMGADVDIYVVAAQDAVKETLKLTGLEGALFIHDVYDAAVIENI
jgi:anti-anti-sigma factor